MTRIDIGDQIDRQRLTALQIVVLVLCTTIALLDGFDTQAIGYVAPAIIKSWAVPKATLGPVFSAGLFGSLLGALMFGPLADRFGRKPMLLVCTLVFGIGALASSMAHSVDALLTLRFVTGLGMGGAMPIGISLTSEYMPKRVRATMVTITYCGFSLGAALGGVAANQLIGTVGWRGVFILGGAAPLALFVVIAAFLPESIRFLLLRRQDSPQVRRILDRLGIVYAGAQRYRSTEEVRGRAWTVGQLFSEGRWPFTVAIWVIVFMNLIELYFFSSWLPTVISEAGANHAALITALFQVGGTVGALLIGKLVDRLPPLRVLAAVYLGAAVFVASVGMLLTGSTAVLTLAVTLAGFCVVGGQIGVIAVTSSAYPTTIRSSGVGWALGIGRVGSVVGPFVGSALMQAQFPDSSLFLFGAIPALIASVTAVGLDVQRRSRRLDDDSSVSDMNVANTVVDAHR
jgi:MFS transporter, AAHS family, 4-hydroxybenzoate transporter